MSESTKVRFGCNDKFDTLLTFYRISVYNPTTEELLSDQIPVAGEHDVDAAVAAGNDAFVKWRAWPGAKRRQLLLKFADLLERDQEELGFLTRLTLGAPYLAFGQGEIQTAVENFRCKT